MNKFLISVFAICIILNNPALAHQTGRGDWRNWEYHEDCEGNADWPPGSFERWNDNHGNHPANHDDCSQFPKWLIWTYIIGAAVGIAYVGIVYYGIRRPKERRSIIENMLIEEDSEYGSLKPYMAITDEDNIEAGWRYSIRF